MGEVKKLYVNPLPVRIWHWTNAVLFIVLIVTGVQVRYLDLFSLMSFRTAVVAHNWTAFALIANYLLWLLFYLFSDRNKAYHPEFNLIKLAEACFRQLQYYGWGMFKGGLLHVHPSLPRDAGAHPDSAHQGDDHRVRGGGGRAGPSPVKKKGRIPRSPGEHHVSTSHHVSPGNRSRPGPMIFVKARRPARAFHRLGKCWSGSVPGERSSVPAQ